MIEKTIDKILIVSITPYFLERDNFWIEQNFKKILDSRKTQSFFQDNTVYLEINQNLSLSELLRQLDELGYEKVLKTDEPGEFSHLGGMINVFPINLNYAIQIEFLGNSIEGISKLPIEIENEENSRKLLKKKLKSQKTFSDLKGLKPNEYLVHLDHGIGKFLKKEKLSISSLQEYYTLEYAAEDKLYVPVGLERKLSRYVGFTEPKISRLGSMVWQKTKRKIKKETENLAKELLAIAAQREETIRIPYEKDSEIDNQIAATFPYEETPDQIQTLEEIKKDLESNKPMDRIVCGDVGFGKTEIALRAMAKTINAGEQSALIAPTTILADQHYQTFKERLWGLPIKIALMSRLQSKKEQKDTIKDIKDGKIDIVIGTHRVLSKDIEFKKLGLLVIDDEQKFGVKQKEVLKNKRAELNVLSLSATPIPRTLYMAMSSLRDISIIKTPPEGRMAVKIFIKNFSTKTIQKAIKQELKRKGQVYYLHNRVQTIHGAKKFLEELLPDVRFEIAHGKLPSKNLMQIMTDFKNKKFDVLIATTIIENGIDLPNVNTLIVADATRLGLSQSYQIKGRIGRSHIQAFSYFFYGQNMSKKAKMRLSALKEINELGSGHRIALKDMEIRGAGNMLGKEQSGSINKVGLNFYCQMLSLAIEKMKNK
ncbi:MAG: DEAD/DEAH box helicase [Patescibacteria group bacterium]